MHLRGYTKLIMYDLVISQSINRIYFQNLCTHHRYTLKIYNFHFPVFIHCLCISFIDTFCCRSFLQYVIRSLKKQCQNLSTLNSSHLKVQKEQFLYMQPGVIMVLYQRKSHQ